MKPIIATDIQELLWRYAKRLDKLFGSTVLITGVGSRCNYLLNRRDVTFAIADVSKLKKLGWVPSVPFKESIRRFRQSMSYA